jgi:hypothetical protein
MGHARSHRLVSNDDRLLKVIIGIVGQRLGAEMFILRVRRFPVVIGHGRFPSGKEMISESTPKIETVRAIACQVFPQHRLFPTPPRTAPPARAYVPSIAGAPPAAARLPWDATAAARTDQSAPSYFPVVSFSGTGAPSCKMKLRPSPAMACHSGRQQSGPWMRFSGPRGTEGTGPRQKRLQAHRSLPGTPPDREKAPWAPGPATGQAKSFSLCPSLFSRAWPCRWLDLF